LRQSGAGGSVLSVAASLLFAGASLLFAGACCRSGAILAAPSRLLPTVRFLGES
jgi:hypothetical protein